jgi:hypothetical protein
MLHAQSSFTLSCGPRHRPRAFASFRTPPTHLARRELRDASDETFSSPVSLQSFEDLTEVTHQFGLRDFQLPTCFGLIDRHTPTRASRSVACAARRLCARRRPPARRALPGGGGGR